jgi:hypothetical protein
MGCTIVGNPNQGALMLEIIFLVACGWLSMVNPTDNLKLPIGEWEQRVSADSARECESYITDDWREMVQKGLGREWKSQSQRYRCVPADVVYSHAPKK